MEAVIIGEQDMDRIWGIERQQYLDFADSSVETAIGTNTASLGGKLSQKNKFQALI